MNSTFSPRYFITLMSCALLVTAASGRAEDLSPDDDLPQDLSNIYGSFDNVVKFMA
jgi:hypothetical protein